MSNKKLILTILALSIATHFAFFGHPNETVFDEVHFGKFVSGYYTGEYYFDIHPPLGKLMIAGFAKLFDFQPEYSFTDIGNEFPDKKYLALRFLPVLAGTLLPIIIFLLAIQIGISKIGAFTAGLLIIFDNALLTQSRFILLDPFLLLLGFTSLLFYFKYLNAKPGSAISGNPKRVAHPEILLLGMAIFAGLAVSIKWTGLSFIALPILIETARNLNNPNNRQTDIKLAIASFMSVFKFASFFVISLVIYFSVFALHFTLLPKPGQGDAFMKPNFREQNVIKNIVDLNIEMYKSNQRLTATHPYSSQWYAWPLMTRPIYYWVKDDARVYFFGNPVIWWGSTAAVIILLLRNLQFSKPTLRFSEWGIAHSRGTLSALRPLRVGVYNFQLKTEHILLGGYFLNLLPFIGVKRVMFLYHYLIPLIFAILILVYLVDKSKNSRKIFTGIVVASIAAFLFFTPLNYGLPLSDKAYEARVWFASWK